MRMFTGLVQSLGIVAAMEVVSSGHRLVVNLADSMADAAISRGDSIAVEGVCLTVAEHTPRQVSFDVVAQTLRATTLGLKKTGDLVNLELSLRVGDFLGGHFVQGHVDAITSVLEIDSRQNDWGITLAIPHDARSLLVHRGSVAIDGVSMTIAAADRHTFRVAVIPTTREKTTLGKLKVGDCVNIETDILARTIVHYLKVLQVGTSATDDPWSQLREELSAGRADT